MPIHKKKRVDRKGPNARSWWLSRFASITHQLAGTADIGEVRGKLQQRKLTACYLVVGGHARLSFGFVRVWQQFYEIRRNFQTYRACPGRRQGATSQLVSAEIEQAELDHAQLPRRGVRVEQELRLKGIQVSSGGVRGVWQRHNLLTKHERLLRLEWPHARSRLRRRPPRPQQQKENKRAEKKATKQGV